MKENRKAVIATSISVSICNQVDVILNVLVTFADNFSVSFTISKNNCKYIFNNLKLKNLNLPLKVEIDQFVICLVLLVSFFQNVGFHFTLTETRIVTAFCSFPA